jgi:AraC-like DNA-binding protein
MKVAVVCEHDQAATILDHVERALAHERVRATARERRMTASISHFRCLREAAGHKETYLPSLLFVAGSSILSRSLTSERFGGNSPLPCSLFEWDSVVIMQDTQSSIDSFTKMLEDNQICRLCMVNDVTLHAEKLIFEFVRALCLARINFRDRICRCEPWRDRFMLLPTAARGVVERVCFDPSEWTVKRLCAEMHAERRTIERWFRRAGLPSPAGLIAAVQEARFPVGLSLTFPREQETSADRLKVAGRRPWSIHDGDLR